MTYQRTFPHTDWQAWYVPFSIGASQFESALTLVGSVTQDGVTNLVFQTVEGELQANTPYLVKPVEQTSTYLQGMTNVTLYAAPATDGATVTDAFTLTGTYQGKNDMRTTNAYALSDGLFKRAKSDEAVLKPFRVYLTATAEGEAPAQLGVVLDDEVDAIESVRGTELLDCYDLQGRRVQLPAKGLYIVNGKKVLY
ncbi:MAG: hypothetical protein HUK02_03145 [Bacteroidaceae bacterium]|nr:hypothetical protein [Bacteroidaceae bacterium]